MASNYSDRLKLELMATGANANTWGTNTNNNLEVIDAFGGGYLSKSVAGSADVTLTTNNADPTAESSNKVIEFTGALTGDIKVFVPAVENNYIFFNNTTGSQTLSIAPTGHSGNAVAITQGAHTIMYITNDNRVVDLFSNSLGNVSVKGTTSVDGNVTIAPNGLITATSFKGSGSGLSDVSTIDAGTQMVFLQASAPTGWTQNTASSLANATLRVITTGTAGTGGSDTFQTVFGGSKSTSGAATADISPLSVDTSGLSVGSTTISTPTLPSHSHNFKFGPTEGRNPDGNPSGGSYKNAPGNTNATGGGGGHTHPVSGSASVSGNIGAPSVSLSVPGMDIKHANVIVCSKDS